MKILHSDMNEIWSIINAVLVSSKRRDNYEAVIWELISSGAICQAVHLPSYDTETSWSSAFHMFIQTQMACKAF